MLTLWSDCAHFDQNLKNKSKLSHNPKHSVQNTTYICSYLKVNPPFHLWAGTTFQFVLHNHTKISYARHLCVNKVLPSLRLGMLVARCVNKVSLVSVHSMQMCFLVLCWYCTAASNKRYYFCTRSVIKSLCMSVDIFLS